MGERYFLDGEDGVEVEVTKTQYVNAERRAGFHNTLGQPDEPATSAFRGGGLSGRLRYVRDEEAPDGPG